eukprot:gene24194-27371_t
MNVLVIFDATAIPKCRHFLKTFSKSVKHVKVKDLQRLELLIQPEFVLRELVGIEAFPCLITLSISCADNILDSDIIATLRKAPHLQHINASMCELLTDATGVYIAENVSQLKTLDLSYGNFTESTLTALAELRGNSLHALNN